MISARVRVRGSYIKGSLGYIPRGFNPSQYVSGGGGVIDWMSCVPSVHFLGESIQGVYVFGVNVLELY